MGLKGIIYARVGTTTVVSKMLDIATQIHECEKWAKEQGIHILDIFHDENASGLCAREEREGFHNALSHVEQCKVDFFIVFDLARFAYAFEDIALYKSILDKHETSLIPVSLLVRHNYHSENE